MAGTVSDSYSISRPEFCQESITLPGRVEFMLYAFLSVNAPLACGLAAKMARAEYAILL